MIFLLTLATLVAGQIISINADSSVEVVMTSTVIPALPTSIKFTESKPTSTAPNTKTDIEEYSSSISNADTHTKILFPSSANKAASLILKNGKRWETGKHYDISLVYEGIDETNLLVLENLTMVDSATKNVLITSCEKTYPALPLPCGEEYFCSTINCTVIVPNTIPVGNLFNLNAPWKECSSKNENICSSVVNTGSAQLFSLSIISPKPEQVAQFFKAPTPAVFVIIGVVSAVMLILLAIAIYYCLKIGKSTQRNRLEILTKRYFSTSFPVAPTYHVPKPVMEALPLPNKAISRKFGKFSYKSKSRTKQTHECNNV